MKTTGLPHSIITEQKSCQKGKPLSFLQHIKLGGFEDVELILRFKKEMELLLSLSHSCLEKLLYFSVSDDLKTISYEICHTEEENLEDFVKANPDINTRLSLIIELSDVLSYIHSKNLIHKSISVKNIKIKKNKDKSCSLILKDTGRFYLYQSIDKNKTTEDFLGIAPEQTGILKRRIDARTDLYSSGVVAYYILTGNYPFFANDIGSLINQHITKTPLKPTAMDKALPDIFDSIIMKLLSKNPEHRYQSAKSLHEDLTRYKKKTDKGQYSGEFIIASTDIKILDFQTRLIGRKKEIEKLASSLIRASQKSGNFILIEGESGSGKTRLLSDFRDIVVKENGMFLSTGCSELKKTVPYKPITDIFNIFASKIMKYSDEKKNIKIREIREILGSYKNIFLSFSSGFEELFCEKHISEKIYIEQDVNPLFEIFSNLLVSMASKKEPLVILFDDIHNCDEGTLSFLSYFNRKIIDLNMLILCAFRPSKHLNGFSKILSSCISLKLQNLEKEEIKTLINEIFHYKFKNCDKLAEDIYFKYAGNPFLSIEALKLLIERKIIIRDKNTFSLSGYKTSAFPEDIFEITKERLPGLSNEAKSVLNVASVLNEEFSIETIKSLLSSDTGFEKIINAVDESLASNLIWDVSLKEGVYSFIHEEVKTSFYNRLSDEEKEDYHLRCAKHFESFSDLARFEDSFILSYHYSRTSLKKKAFYFLLESAEKAYQIFSYYEAVEYYREAIELIDTLENSKELIKNKVELLLKYVYLTTNFGDFDENIEKMLSCLELLKNFRIETSRFEVIITLGRINFIKGNIFDAFNWYEKALAYSKEINNNYYSGIAYKYLGLSHLFVTNDYNQAIKYLEKSVNYFSEEELVSNIEALSFLASSQAELGYFDDSLSNINRAFDTIKKTDNPMKLSYILHYASVIYNVMGDFPLSLFYSEKTYETAVKNHDKLMEYSSLYSKSVALYYLGKYQSGIICAENALDIATANNINLGLPLIYIIIGACYSNTNPEKGIEIINKGEEIAKKASDKNAIQQALRFKGIAYRYLRNFDASLKCLSQAAEITEELELKPERARNLIQLGLTYKSIGKESLSFDCIESAIEIFEELKMNAQLKRIKDIFKEVPENEDTLYKKSLKEHIELTTILKINKLALNINNIDVLLENILALCVNALGAQKGLLMVYDEGILNLKVMHNFSNDNLSRNHILLSESAIMFVEEYQKGICINENNLREYTFETVTGKIPSCVCVPLFVKDILFGVVYLENEFLPYIFNSGDLEVLEVITSEASISIENALKLKEKETQITELKKEKHNILSRTEEQKSFTENMLDTSPLAVMSTTTDGDITYINRAMKRITGTEKNGFNIFEEDILNEEMKLHYMQALSGLGSTIEIVKYISKLKDEYYLNCSFITKPDPQGEFNSVNLLFLDITEKVIAQQQLNITNIELAKLNDVAKAVNSTLDLKTVLESTLLMLKELFPIDGFVIYLYDHDEKAILYKKGLFPDIENYSLPDKPIYLPDKYSRLLNVIEKKMFLHVKRVPSVLSTYFPDNVKSCFFAPIEFKNEVIGLIQFFSVEKILIINERENFFLASFINQIASAINNSAVYEKLSKALSDLERVHKKLKEKTDTLTEDMKLARKVQQGILPTDFTNITELEIFLRYFPLQQVGGDLYDITKLDNNIVRVFICDATGHGVQAALTTMAIKTLYEKGKRTCKTPGELLNYLSKEYSLIPDTGNLFTAFVADINTEDLILHYANAGHPYPVLVTKEGCKHVSGREMMMGLDYSRADYKTHSIKISASDKLFIFTDGLYEEFNSQMDEYGEKNIADFLLKNKELPLEELGKGLIKDVQTFMDRKSLNDDLCLLGIKIK